ncbi:hypothetical protein FOA52_002516 [Chlamydomonas sp. UWO 241]|nr:hypothetical protein FOA52_002516 [Chlamydomonas sp. UWO 241]
MGKPPPKPGGCLKGKKKNSGVGVDFKRIKAKVGKKLKKAANETNVSFKSAVINLPAQTVQAEKDGIAVNHQNLTLSELLVQTGHYSEKARKAALSGLCDLFAKHPQELPQNTHAFFTKVTERVADGDAGVRQALRVLLSEHAFNKLPPGAIRPFMPVLMAHVASAMTNLNMNVRLDALNFLGVLMDYVPQLVVAGFLSTCLEHFCDLLSQAHRGRSVTSQSISALNKVVVALNAFLRRAFPAGVHGGGPGSGGAAAGAGPGPSSSAAAAAAGSSDSRSVRAGPASRSATAAAAGAGVLMGCRLEWPPEPAPMPNKRLRGARPVVLVPVVAASAAAPRVDVLQGPIGNSGGSKFNGSGKRSANGAALLASASGGARAASAKPASKQAPSADASKHSAADSASSKGGVDGSGDTAALTRRLLSLLFEVWAECGPAKTVASPELEPLQAMTGILSASVSLTNNLLMKRVSVAAAEGGDAGGTQPLSSLDLDALAWVSELALRRVPPHFPALVPSVKPSAGVSDALVAYNLVGSQLLGLLLPVPAHLAAQAAHQAQQQQARHAPQQHEHQAGSGVDAVTPPAWASRLLYFYCGVLERGEVVPAGGGLSELSSLTGATTNASYLSVLRCVSAALPYVPASSAAALMGAVQALCDRVAARSPVRAACVRLQYALMAAVRVGHLRSIDGARLGAWLDPLPKLLWELGDSAADTSDLCLRMLLDAGRFTARGEAYAAGGGGAQSLRCALDAMQPRLAPLFCVHMPAQAGSKAGGTAQLAQLAQPAAACCAGCGACGAAVSSARAAVTAARERACGAPAPAPMVLLPGPVAKLPLETQLLAVDLVYHLGALNAALLKALAAAVHDARVLSRLDVALRLLDITLARMGAEHEEPAAAAAWAHTLLFTDGGSSSQQQHPSGSGSGSDAAWARTRAVTDAVCRALPGWAPMGSTLRLMGPQLGPLLAGGSAGLGDQQRYSLVRLAAAAVASDNGMQGATATTPACLPAAVQSALPSVVMDLFASRLVHGHAEGAALGGADASGAFGAGVGGSAAATAVAALVLPTALLAAQPEALLLPLMAHASAWGSCAGCVSGGEHGGPCMLARFRASAMLLQQLLGCRPLQPALLLHSDRAAAAVASLVAHGQQHPQLSGNSSCRAACSRLEQASVDVLPAMKK